MSHLRLLSTDFDGTLIEHHSDGRCSADFAEVLILNKKAGGLWALNTGRSLDLAIEGLAAFGAPAEPNFLLTTERDIFLHARDGTWTPHHEWTDRCRRRHAELFVEAQDVIRRVCELAANTSDITIIHENGKPIGLVTATESVMSEVALFLDREARDFPSFSYQRNTVYLRFCHLDYHKGSSLAELCRLFGIERTEVFTAGDHFNDIPMLDGRFSTFPCCPSNAIPEVRAAVIAAGGHVAGRPAADGVADAWHFFHRSPSSSDIA